ncbi:OmpA family protein [Qaidamihabitans albus]|uniref:OmpA family protein n=1 Tax=Qaidamihabitans albus TaxID=2795733 RepID=UPI0018F1CA0A|nr:OmpA family protein [Qaidamihabitans albus]
MSGGGGRLWLIPLALVVTGALALAATWSTAGRIESDLAARARAALGEAGLPAAGVTFDGRDARIGDVPPEQAQRALDAVRELDGVRTAELAEPAAEREPEFSGDERQRLQADLDRLLAAQPITFRPDTAELTPQGERAVSQVVDLVEKAPTDTTFEIGGHVAPVPGGDPRTAEELSRQRAEAVADRLVAAGIARERVHPVGYGDTRPRSDGGASELDRRVEITVR